MSGRGRIGKPAEEGTADQSTQSASGLGAGRDAGRDEQPEDVVARHRPGVEETPRRYDADDHDPVMPSDEPTLKTNI